MIGGSVTQYFLRAPTQNWSAKEFLGLGFLIVIVSMAWASFINRVG